jgi:hypothetical protein
MKLGQIVYLKTDPSQLERIITGILLRQTGKEYYLGCGEIESSHYEIEITLEKDWTK